MRSLSDNLVNADPHSIFSVAIQTFPSRRVGWQLVSEQVKKKVTLYRQKTAE